jgi:hypothetical protein
MLALIERRDPDCKRQQLTHKDVKLTNRIADALGFKLGYRRDGQPGLLASSPSPSTGCTGLRARHAWYATHHPCRRRHVHELQEVRSKYFTK